MYISFGGGLRLLSEDHYLREFARMGVTRTGFRRLCAALGVPVVHISKRIRLIDWFAFVLCLRTATLPHSPDFYAHAVTPADSPLASPHGWRNELPLEDIRSRLDEAVALLVASRHLAGLSTASEFITQLRESAERTSRASRHTELHSFHPSTAASTGKRRSARWHRVGKIPRNQPRTDEPPVPSDPLEIAARSPFPA